MANLSIFRAFYLLNAVTAGRAGLQLLRNDARAIADSFGGPVTPPLAADIIGSAWLGVAICSVFGLLDPVTFSPLLLFQVVYKALVVLKATLPALASGQRDHPAVKMGLVFNLWVIVLPFFLPWGHLTAGLRRAIA